MLRQNDSFVKNSKQLALFLTLIENKDLTKHYLPNFLNSDLSDTKIHSMNSLKSSMQSLWLVSDRFQPAKSFRSNCFFNVGECSELTIPRNIDSIVRSLGFTIRVTQMFIFCWCSLDFWRPKDRRRGCSGQSALRMLEPSEQRPRNTFFSLLWHTRNTRTVLLLLVK